VIDAAESDDAVADQLVDGSDSGPLCVPTVMNPCATQLSLGQSHTCALLADGTIRCWGQFGQGQLGIGDADGAAAATLFPIPVQVASLNNAKGVELGQTHSCAWLGDTSMWCWGNAGNGRLGMGAVSGAVKSPTQVLGVDDDASTLSDVLVIALGSSHTCALLPEAGACWGLNSAGQLGVGDFVQRSIPAAVSPGNATRLTLGGTHSCVLISGGTVRCWGNNLQGQLGLNDGFATPKTASPTDVPGLSSVLQVAAGGAHTCALLSGAVKCWGDNSNRQLGIGFAPDGGNISNTDVPTDVQNLPSDIVQITCGANHTCALKNDGTAYCWGGNGNYQIGGTGPTSVYPKKVNGLSNAVEIRAGFDHTCARQSDDTVLCWGQNGSGQVGNVTAADAGLVAKVPDPTVLQWQ
jgi:alpha-tubulin suppressor-like RCC1 family protein